eukprot:gene10306-11406_t
MSDRQGIPRRDIFTNFIPDDRRTVSDEPYSRRTNRNLNILLQSGSRSDSASHRKQGGVGNGRFKGISNRTLAMVSAINADRPPSASTHSSSTTMSTSTLSADTASPSIQEYAEPVPTVGLTAPIPPVYQSPSSSSLSYISASGGIAVDAQGGDEEDYVEQSTSRKSSHSDEDPPSPLDSYRKPIQSVRPSATYTSKPVSAVSNIDLIPAEGNRGLSSLPVSSSPNDENAAKIKIYQKLHPTSPSFALDPLACESRDSEEEMRIRELRVQQANQHISDSPGLQSLSNSKLSTSLDNDNALSIGGRQAEGQQVVKVFLVGDSGVGKTSILHQYFDGSFSEDCAPTDGVDFKGKLMQYSDGDIEYKLQLWDSAGSLALHNITKSYYRKAHAFAIVYDITNYTTVENIPFWIETIRTEAINYILSSYTNNTVNLSNLYSVSTTSHSQDLSCSNDYLSSTSGRGNGSNCQVDPTLLTIAQTIPIILIGNKADLSTRIVDSDTMERYARDAGLYGYFEVSASMNINISVALEVLSHLGFQRWALLHDYSQSLKQVSSISSGYPMPGISNGSTLSSFPAEESSNEPAHKAREGLYTSAATTSSSSHNMKGMQLVPDARSSSFASLEEAETASRDNQQVSMFGNRDERDSSSGEVTLHSHSVDSLEEIVDMEEITVENLMKHNQQSNTSSPRPTVTTEGRPAESKKSIHSKPVVEEEDDGSRENTTGNSPTERTPLRSMPSPHKQGQQPPSRTVSDQQSTSQSNSNKMKEGEKEKAQSSCACQIM